MLFNGVFQCFAGSKLGHFLGRDLDRFACLGISSCPCGSLRDGESSKTDEGDLVSFFEGLLDGIKDGIDGANCLHLAAR